MVGTSGSRLLAQPSNGSKVFSQLRLSRRPCRRLPPPAAMSSPLEDVALSLGGRPLVKGCEAWSSIPGEGGGGLLGAQLAPGKTNHL